MTSDDVELVPPYGWEGAENDVELVPPYVPLGCGWWPFVDPMIVTRPRSDRELVAHMRSCEACQATMATVDPTALDDVLAAREGLK